MNFRDLANAIIITKDKTKSSIIKKINSENKLLNIKVISLRELKTKYFFDYGKNAIYYVSKKYNVIPEIAKIYIDNTYFIKDIDNEKIKFLSELKSDLESNNLLKKDIFFKEYLKNKKIILYNLENTDKFYKNIFKELEKVNEVIVFNEKKNISKKCLYKSINKEEECAFVASEIAKLIKSGIDINRIKLANVSDEYYFTLNNIFKSFKIPLELPTKTKASGTILVKKFKELYSDNMEEVVENLIRYMNGKEDEAIYKSIIDIINDYVWCNSYNDIKDMLLKDIDNIKVDGSHYKNAVRVISFEEDVIDDEDYIFLINFNQGSIPVIKKDEDYLNDEIKRQLDISDSIDTNKYKIREIQKRIEQTKHLVVTYSKYDLTSEQYLSSAYSKDLFIESDVTIDFSSSNLYNKTRLLCLKDEYKKYGTKSKELFTLMNHYKDEPYNSYDNTFKGIDSDKLINHLNKGLTLSYSSMNTYYKCGFRYYLDSILRLNSYENTFQTTIGNIFHKILSECFVDDYDFEAAWNKCIIESTYEFNNMETFFINKLKNELMIVIDTIKKQMEYTSLKKVLYEKEIVIPIDENMKVKFIGYIDKLLYNDEGEETIIAVIDYKTGDPDLNITNIPYGIDMQLPIYIYLIKKSGLFKNVRIGGFYLQKILNTSTDPIERINNLRLQGYSNSDMKVLKAVDSSFKDSKVIKSMKVTSDFSTYAKVLSDANMDTLSNIVEQKINEASTNILNGDFSINPKEIDGSLIGCKFCNYKDICYMKNSDIIKLAGLKNADILGGETNGELD